MDWSSLAVGVLSAVIGAAIGVGLTVFAQQRQRRLDLKGERAQLEANRAVEFDVQWVRRDVWALRNHGERAMVRGGAHVSPVRMIPVTRLAGEPLTAGWSSDANLPELAAKTGEWQFYLQTWTTDSRIRIRWADDQAPPQTGEWTGSIPEPGEPLGPKTADWRVQYRGGPAPEPGHVVLTSDSQPWDLINIGDARADDVEIMADGFELDGIGIVPGRQKVGVMELGEAVSFLAPRIVGTGRLQVWWNDDAGSHGPQYVAME